MQALCGLQGIFDLFNCKTPACTVQKNSSVAFAISDMTMLLGVICNLYYNPIFDS